MIMQRGNELICICDHRGCRGILRSSVDIAWKMYEIVFGVYPSILPRINQAAVTTLKKFHFCDYHRKICYEDAIIMSIAGWSGKPLNNICNDPNLHGDLGCWVTLID